jgi:hypothetical protein
MLTKETKFRGKSFITKGWIYGYYFSCLVKKSASEHNTKHYFIIGEEHKLNEIGFEAEVNPNTVCEYTRHKDKAHNEVYENDIMAGLFGNFTREWEPTGEGEYQIVTTEMRVVKWNIEKCQWYCEDKRFKEKCIPLHENKHQFVVGNIHDNKDLVELIEQFSDKEEDTTNNVVTNKLTEKTHDVL